MSETTYKPYTINELLDLLWEDNKEHFEDISVWTDCDCINHSTLKIIMSYIGE